MDKIRLGGPIIITDYCDEKYMYKLRKHGKKYKWKNWEHSMYNPISAIISPIEWSIWYGMRFTSRRIEWAK